MNIQDIWAQYSEDMAAIEMFQRAIRDTSNVELERMQQLKVEYVPTQGDPVSGYATHSMSFKDAKSGERVFYGQKLLSLDDLLLNAVLRKNRQYQWLVAEAYELFEGFLFRTYAVMAAAQKDAWPLSDYGNITISELASQNLSWYEDRASKKKGAPGSILARFRKLMPTLSQFENSNELKVNMSFAISLVKNLRHLVVHKGGKTANKNEFVNLVASEAGALNNGVVAAENRQLVELFFGSGAYENLILLLEIPIQNGLPIATYHCRFEILTNVLMSYARMLFELTQEYVDAPSARAEERSNGRS